MKKIINFWRSVVIILVLGFMFANVLNVHAKNKSENISVMNSDVKIEKDSLKLEKESVNIGEPLKISVNITSTEILNSVELIYQQGDWGDEIKSLMTYNSSTNRYECYLKFEEAFLIGKYKISAIEVNGVDVEEYNEYFYVKNTYQFDKNGFGTAYIAPLDEDISWEDEHIKIRDYDDSWYIDFPINIKLFPEKVTIKITACDGEGLTDNEFAEQEIIIDSTSEYFNYDYLKREIFYPGKSCISLYSGWDRYNSAKYYKIEIKKSTIYPETGNIPSAISMKTDSSKTIELSNIMPSNATKDCILWSTSNSKILKISGKKSVCKINAKKEGTAYVYAKLKNGNIYKTKVKVTNPKPYLKWNAYEMCISDKEKIALVYAKGKIKYKSSNKKVATVSNKGVIKAKNIGKCTITVYNKGKKYKIKVKVIRQDPNFGAALYDYRTRNNEFIVKYKNKSNKSLKILKGITKVEDCDYKIYDRKIKLAKNYTIKPNQSKTLKFKVIGSTTWPDYSDYTLEYKFKFDGKVYIGHTWDSDSSFKQKKGWYTTYWSRSWYNEWNPNYY